MRKSFYKRIAAAAAVSCLLTGCGRNGMQAQKAEEADFSESVSDDLTELFDQDFAAAEVGSFSYGWQDERDVFSYSGEPLEIPFMLTGTMEGSPQEVGLLLFVDGIAQPYSVAFSDGTRLAEAYMQTFWLEQDVKNVFDLVFQPVTGKNGDSLSVQAVVILKPGYLPENEENPNYGVYHSANITIPLQIAFEKDAPGEGQKAASDSYEIVDIPKAVTDSDEIFGFEDGRDANTVLSVVPAEEEGDGVIRSGEGAVTFKVRLYGGPEADQNITVFVNHQPVQIGGADYLAVRTQKEKMVEAAVTLDASAFGERNTIYAVASSAGRDSGLTETVKSPSVFFLNREGGALSTDETDVTQHSGTASYPEPQYDARTGVLTLTDLAANAVQASYHFDGAQSLLSVEKIPDGVVVLAAQKEAETKEADVEASNGISFSSNTGSAKNVIIYRFDEQLNLLDSFCPDDPDLADTLTNYPYAVSPDGEELTWVQEDGVYRYELETGEVKQAPLSLPEMVYFVQIRYSESGKSLFYHGGGEQEGVTFYGVLDAKTGEGTLFRANDFDAISIEVTGEYAVVNAAVLPGKVSGSGRVLLIDGAGKTGKELTLKSQSENDLAVVTGDGKSLVTCAATGERGGVLRCYDTADGRLQSEQSYSSEQESKPYLLLVQNQNARAVLYTEQGFSLSAPMRLP